MINIPTELLRTLLAVVDLRSFTKAAQSLGVTQPAVSAQIKRLQGLVGADLLDKSAPGVTLTPMVATRLEDERFRKINTEMTPHQRLGRVEDIASTVAFLCSEGGSFINGQTIVVDGGWSSTKYLSDFALNADWVAR